MAKRKTRPIFAYDANYPIDNKRGVIVDAEGTRANRSEEHDAAKTMIDRARQRLGLGPRRLAAETADGAAPILKWLMDRGIEPHIPVWDKSRRADGTFSRRERKKVEMAFAHLKRILKLDRLRLRGLSGARDEILLAATAQNLRKPAKYAGPAPPGSTAHCPA